MNVDHGTFTIEKIIAASPANVFRAFAEEELKRQWFVHPGLSSSEYSLDFGPRGREAGRFVLDEGPGAGVHENATTYLDVVEGERISYAYSMAWDGRVHSASLVTVTFAPTEAGCKLTVTEQG
ncbi:MAG: SRPBCC domain-containing protein, partial [Maritimibacter sp.]|nr:SRPBCC domain-containing protein [Maritimibacter sp.]